MEDMPRKPGVQAREGATMNGQEGKQNDRGSAAQRLLARLWP